ncbi:alpha/beta fold hydrolase [Sphingosinicella terrae]|uniref:alpha/beta fold hydrolase n=1 Tax=Sphingosinicella terrae TaxID=2172047 RepID=UPI000E0D033C|nr:alpha/beta hydrolase [Sphingosinicella terrae]
MIAIRTREIPVPGGAIALEEAGEGPPILLLHGWAMDRRVWAPQIEGLADRHRPIAIDRRGFGRSTAPPDIAREMDDLVEVRRALGLGPMVVVGLSQGGRVALRFALDHPESVLALVLVGAPLDGFAPGPRGEEAIPLSSYAALAQAGRIDRVRALWRRHPLMRGEAGEARRALDVMLEAYEGRDLAAGAAHELRPIVADLEAVYAPVLVVTGERDTPWRQLAGDALAYGLPHGRRARIAGAGHVCSLSQAAVFNGMVRELVERAETDGARATQSRDAKESRPDAIADHKAGY